MKRIDIVNKCPNCNSDLTYSHVLFSNQSSIRKCKGCDMYLVQKSVSIWIKLLFSLISLIIVLPVFLFIMENMTIIRGVILLSYYLITIFVLNAIFNEYVVEYEAITQEEVQVRLAKRRKYLNPIIHTKHVKIDADEKGMKFIVSRMLLMTLSIFLLLVSFYFIMFPTYNMFGSTGILVVSLIYFTIIFTVTFFFIILIFRWFKDREIKTDKQKGENILEYTKRDQQSLKKVERLNERDHE